MIQREGIVPLFWINSPKGIFKTADLYTEMLIVTLFLLLKSPEPTTYPIMEELSRW